MTTTEGQQQSRIKQETRILVQAAAAVCEEKKGNDTRILELDPIDSGLSDFFLVTSASNDRQAVAIADEIEARLKREFGAYANSVEGRRQGECCLLYTSWGGGCGGRARLAAGGSCGVRAGARALPLEPVISYGAGSDGSQFFSFLGARRDAYRVSASDERRRNGENWPRLFGFWRKRCV